MVRLPMRNSCLSTSRGASVAWMVWRQDDDSRTRRLGIFGEVGVGVALHHRQPARHAGFTFCWMSSMPAAVHALARPADSSSAPSPQPMSSTRAPARTISAIAAGRAVGVGGADRVRRTSRFMAATFRRRNAALTARPRPRSRAWCRTAPARRSRKASWPRSVSISTKLTLAPAAFSACAMRLFSLGREQPVAGERDEAEARLACRGRLRPARRHDRRRDRNSPSRA